MLAEVVRASGPVLTRFLAGFTEETRTKQGPGLPNHVAWTLGHCAYTMGRLVERFGGPALPEKDFIAGDGTKGNTEKFDTLSVRLNSYPVDDPKRYPTLVRSREIFDGAVARLASVVEASDGAKLETLAPWGEQKMSLGTLVMRVSLHNAQHAGQLADLRRALDMPRIAG